MNLIKLGETSIYPYTLEDFRRHNPSFDFPDDLEGVDLSIFEVARVTEEPIPEHDPLTHIADPLPVLINAEWIIQWVLRELTAEEITEIKRRRPPDWVGFNEAISFDSNMINYEFAANAIHPSIVGKKDLAYSIINSGGLDNFAMVFPLFCFLAEVTQEHRNEWADMAESFNLPPDFVAVVRGT